MLRRKFGNGGNGGHRPDAKQMTRNKNRFSAIDSDISSAYVDDEDIAPSVGARTHGRITRKPNEVYRAGDKKNRVMEATGSSNAQMVYSIRIFFGPKKFSSKWIIKQLNQKVENLKPILVKETERFVEFYIKDQDTAETVRSMSRRIINPDSKSRIEIIVARATSPWQLLKKDDIELIQAVVDKRYDAPNKTLDLSNFLKDSLFLEKDKMMPLTKNNVMLVVLDRIDERYGCLVALNLSENKLKFLDYLGGITSIAKFLKVLELSQNQISSEEELMKLSELPVETIFFEGNPILESISSANDYLSMIHRVFPRVACLDGNVVQPVATMPMLEDDNAVLEAFPYRAGYYSNDALRSLVEEFIIDFYNFYDGPNGATTRKDLRLAYDENNSTFCLSMQSLKDVVRVRYHNDDVYATYIKQSHNIMFEERFNRNRSQLTTKGAMEIAVRLSKLPITNHLKASFIVDVFLVTSELLGFTVQGLFEDNTLAKEGEVPILQYFSRTFTVAPRPEGKVAVISDMLYISAVSNERIARYKALIDKGIANGPAVGMAVNVNSVQNASLGMNGLGFTTEPSAEVKEQMVSEFCKFSGMLVPWSTKCLEDFTWDYQRASQEFLAHKDSIPKEAFVQ